MNPGKLTACSNTRNWRALHEEIQRLYSAARHRYPRAEHWRLSLIVDTRLLAVGQAKAPSGLMALHAALSEAGLFHAVDARLDDSRGGPPCHRITFHFLPYKNRTIFSKPSGLHYTPGVYFNTQPDCADLERPPPYFTVQTGSRPNPCAQEIEMPDFTIRPATFANTLTKENAAMPNDHKQEIAKRSLLSKLEELIFGKPHDPWLEIRTDDIPPEEGRGDVAQPPVPWLQAFNNALTDATASFIRDYVAPLHAEDRKTGFLLRSIEVSIPDANLPALRVIAEMPAETRNRIAQTRCLKAQGAKEQLVFDQFYGLNVVASDTLVDGFLLRALVASEGSRLNLTFRFSGDYVSLPETIADLIPDETSIPVKSKPLELVRNARPDTGIHPPRTADPGKHTPIRMPRPVDTGKHTPIRMPRSDSHQPLFYITIIEKAGERRVPVDIKMLPLTIGTAPKHTRDITIHPDRSVGACIESFISGEHLELIEYNPTTQLLYVNNKGRNGTYEGGIQLSDRFTLKLAGKKLLSLGGPEGEEGVAQVHIEAV